MQSQTSSTFWFHFRHCRFLDSACLGPSRITNHLLDTGRRILIQGYILKPTHCTESQANLSECPPSRPLSLIIHSSELLA